MHPQTTSTTPSKALGTQHLLAQPQSPLTSKWWQSLWSRREGRIQDIRQLMAAQLTAIQDAAERDTLGEKINSAPHPRDLWALREELRVALVPAHGELLARQRLTDISFMFAGLLEGGPQGNLSGVAGQWSGNVAARGLARRQAHAHTDH